MRGSEVLSTLFEACAWSRAAHQVGYGFLVRQTFDEAQAGTMAATHPGGTLASRSVTTAREEYLRERGNR